MKTLQREANLKTALQDIKLTTVKAVTKRPNTLFRFALIATGRHPPPKRLKAKDLSGAESVSGTHGLVAGVR